MCGDPLSRECVAHVSQHFLNPGFFRWPRIAIPLKALSCRPQLPGCRTSSCLKRRRATRGCSSYTCGCRATLRNYVGHYFGRRSEREMQISSSNGGGKLLSFGGEKKPTKAKKHSDGPRGSIQSLAISALTESNRQKSRRKNGFRAQKSQFEIDFPSHP